MKLINFILCTIIGLGVATASDPSAPTESIPHDIAICSVLFDGEVRKKEIIHYDRYNVEVRGAYSYRTYARDEFYDLLFTYHAGSTPAKSRLQVELIGQWHTYIGSSSYIVPLTPPRDEDFTATVKLTDHELNKVVVTCELITNVIVKNK